VSVNATPVSEFDGFGFVSVKVIDVVPPVGIDVVPNALLIVGGAITVNVAVLLVVPGPLSVDVMTLVILFLTPAVVPFTLKKIWQLCPAATLPPVKLILVAPGLTAAVPGPQLNPS